MFCYWAVRELGVPLCRAMPPGGNAIGRKIRELSKGFELREPKPVYNALYGVKNDDIDA